MNLKRKCLPLKDVKSLRALNAFHALLLGISMLPEYGHLGLTEFTTIVEAMEPKDQLKVLTTGARIVELDPKELKALVCFCTDKNGVPYVEENIKNLGPSDFVEIVVTVCFEILKNIDIDLITDDEKKNLETSPLMSAALF